jgi:serine/threonine protein kinase/Tfp pilus assembly protein PilF
MTQQSSEQSIFLHAIGLPSPADRAGYLDEVCRDKPGLRAELDALLSAHDRLGGGLSPTTGQELAEAREVGPASEGGEDVGAVLSGRYKLVEEIGEGGMGSVWMAQQTEPVKRLVAVKLIKAGMDSQQVLARFEAERQALALMDHPNIARVLDAGATASGRPFFVMELVKGASITRYCDQQRLTAQQRLELFVSVCQAVQHAHQKGIIHRDLKPSNVLVAIYDGKPLPKVIDFGIAKAAGQSLTDKTLVTGFGNIVGTPEYMSPEQAEINQLDIDTRSDIYSLGVLLYELLTGSPPFTRKELEKGGMLEMLRVIREDEPTRPSTKLSTAKGLPTLAANRGTEPAKLAKLVRGELDWIVMKALEKDRNRRYETANAFALDVQRYLADEPVLACPPSVGYRLRKFARRHRSALAVAGLVLFFLVLLGSGAGWVWRDRVAREREAELDRMARAAKQASHLEQAVERAELLQQDGKRGEALAALERARLLAREGTPAPPMAERIAALQERLDAEGRDVTFVARFEAFRRNIQTEVDLKKHQFDAAFPRFREALVEYGIVPGVTPPATVAAHIQRRPAAVQTVVIAALDNWLQAAPEEELDTPKWLMEVLQEADSDPWRNQVRKVWRQSEVLAALARDIDVRQQPPSFLISVANALPPKSPDRLDLSRRVQAAYPGDFWANHGLGWDLAQAGKDAEAVRYYTAALALRPDNLGVLLNRANALQRAGEWDAAFADLRRAIAVEPRFPDAHVNLGLALFAQGQPDEASKHYRMAIEIDPKFAPAYANLGNVLSAQKQMRQAIDAYRTAIELGLSDAKIHNNLAGALYDCKMPAESAEAARAAIKIDPKYAGAHVNLGNALHALGKVDDAIAAFREAIDIDPKRPKALNNLGALLCDERQDYEKAIDCFRKAIALDPKYASAHRNLSNALTQLGWTMVNSPDPKRRAPKRALEAVTEAVEHTPKSDETWQYLGWVQYRASNWRASIEALERSCNLQKGGMGNAGQWIVLALAHARLAAQDGLPEKEREQHRTEARRRFEQADRQIDSAWRVRPDGSIGQAIWDFREEARELLKKESGVRNQA